MAQTAIDRNKSMARTGGSKNLSVKEREDMKSIIRSRFKYGENNEQILESLEDKGYNISESTLKTLKKEIRDSLTARYKEIGKWELAEEHDTAISRLKDIVNDLFTRYEQTQDVLDRVKISQEIRNTMVDLMAFYSTSDVIESVITYFQKEKQKKDQIENLEEL